MNILERKINPHKMSTSKVSLYSKLVTYEGPSHLSKTESVVSNLVMTDVNVACRFISDQLSSHGYSLQHGKFYFKIDHNGELCLLHVTNLKTEPSFK